MHTHTQTQWFSGVVVVTYSIRERRDRILGAPDDDDRWGKRGGEEEEEENEEAFALDSRNALLSNADAFITFNMFFKRLACVLLSCLKEAITKSNNRF